MRRLLFIVAVIGFSLYMLPAPVFAEIEGPTPAQAPATGGLIDRLSLTCRDFGNCDFCDVLDGFAILTRWILGISGAIALALFVWFGFRFIISGGNSATVEAAKKGLVGTVVGLVIIFGGWEIINLVLYATVTTSASNSITTSLGDVILFKGSLGTGNPWYQYCKNRPNNKPAGNIPGVTGS
jgi:hypothetical protein